jgi:hypothetical protein
VQPLLDLVGDRRQAALELARFPARSWPLRLSTRSPSAARRCTYATTRNLSRSAAVRFIARVMLADALLTLPRPEFSGLLGAPVEFRQCLRPALPMVERERRADAADPMNHRLVVERRSVGTATSRLLGHATAFVEHVHAIAFPSS